MPILVSNPKVPWSRRDAGNIHLRRRSSNHDVDRNLHEGRVYNGGDFAPASTTVLPAPRGVLYSKQQTESYKSDASPGHVEITSSGDYHGHHEGRLRSTTSDIVDYDDPRQTSSEAEIEIVEDTSNIPDHIGCCSIFIYLFSVVSYAFDIGSDIFVAVMYYKREHYWWFGWTVFFIVFPAIVMTITSLKWYITDYPFEKEAYKEKAKIRWIPRIFCLVFQVSPVLRYIETVRYGLKSRRACPVREPDDMQHWYQLMLYEDTDAAMLRLIECFLEAAPQLILHIYTMIILKDEPSNGIVLWGINILLIGQIVAAVTSLISFAWAMMAYQKALRLSLPNKGNMNTPASIVYFLWQMFLNMSRILALALFASQFGPWVFLVIGVHTAVMFIWIMLQSSNFCHGSQIWEFLFKIVVTVIYIFCYFNLTDGHTRLRYLFYYFFFFLENIAMVVVWYLATQTQDLWYHSLGMCIVIIGFFLGIMFQLIYYLKFHPNNYAPYDDKMIQFCLTWEEMTNKAGGGTVLRAPSKQSSLGGKDEVAPLNGAGEPANVSIVSSRSVHSGQLVSVRGVQTIVHEC